jgi:CRP-like cAMP-binding protein
MTTLSANQQFILAILTFAALIFFLGLRSKSIKRLFGFKRRKRSSDQRKLTAAEKQTFKEAKNLLQNGRILESARLLESIEFTREAISILEKGKYYHQAVDILLRMRSFDRAGVIYRRNGLFAEAAECFIKGKLPIEAAKCFKFIGEYDRARKLFTEARDFNAAADCCVELAMFREAARLYLKGGDAEKALEQYNAMLDTDVNFQQAQFSEEEVKFFVRILSLGKGDIRLADIDAISNYMSSVIFALIRSRSLDRALEFIKHNVSIVGDELLDNREFSAEESELLADFFSRAGAFSYAGMAFERIGLYEKAALEFEKAEDYERAAYGFERALMKPEANKMRAKHLAMSATNRVSSNRKNYAEGKSNSTNPFSMGDTTKSDIVQMHSFDSGFARENPVANSRPTHLPRIGTQERDILENGSIDNEQMKGFISKQLVFSSLSDAQLNAIDRIKKIRKLAPSSVLIEAGQALSGVFIVVSGKLEVMYERKHQASLDGLLGEGDLIGLDYILTDRNANFTVTCSSPARILELEAGPFLRLVDEDYTFAKELYKNLAVFLLKQEDAPINLPKKLGI